MRSTDPVVTIALPSYNYARFLPGALDAVLPQLDHGLEIVVIDDGSTDSSWDIIQSYAEVHKSILAFRNPHNMGVHATVNRCIALATGRYINFAAVDDRMRPNMLRQSVEMLEVNPDAAFCTAPVLYIDESGALAAPWPGPALGDRQYIPPERARALMCQRGFWVVAASTLYRTELVRAEGGYDDSIGHMADSFLGQVLALRYGFCTLGTPLAEVRLMPTSYSGEERACLRTAWAIRERTAARMRTMPGLFPADFVRNWEELLSVLDALQAWQRTVLGRQKSFVGSELPCFRPKTSWYDGVFVASLKTLGLLQFFILALWCGVCVIDNPLIRPYIVPKRIFFWLKKHCSWGQGQTDKAV